MPVQYRPITSATNRAAMRFVVAANPPARNVSASVDSAVPVVRALPATGAVEPEREAASVTYALAAALTLLILAVAIRRRAA